MSGTIWKNKETLRKFLEEVIRAQSQETNGHGETRHRYRNVWNPKDLEIACDDIINYFANMGYDVKPMEFKASFCFPPDEPDDLLEDPIDELPEWDPKIQRVKNLIVEIKGNVNPDEIIIIGAHYDTRTAMEGRGDLRKQRGRVPDSEVDPTQDCRWNTPGANDNGSGVAALLAIAAAFAGKQFKRTLRMVAWVNEEYPFYGNHFSSEKGRLDFLAEGMGSYRHAKRCAGIDGSGPRENIVCAISFDSMGWYPKKEYRYPGRHFLDRWAIGSQDFPQIGDYVAFLSNDSTKQIVKDFATYYESLNPEVRSFAWSAPPFISSILEWMGAWSDDWSYWQFDYPGFIVTDMAYLRSPRYHRNDDTLEHIDFPEFAQVVWRLKDTVAAFADKVF